VDSSSVFTGTIEQLGPASLSGAGGFLTERLALNIVNRGGDSGRCTFRPASFAFRTTCDARVRDTPTIVIAGNNQPEEL
jgi:hypothetical protein